MGAFLLTVQDKFGLTQNVLHNAVNNLWLFLLIYIH